MCHVFITLHYTKMLTKLYVCMRAMDVIYMGDCFYVNQFNKHPCWHLSLAQV